MSGKRILIVEDVLDLAMFVQTALEEIGIQADHVGTVDDALEYLQSQRPDLIILDIGLPGKSGWELLDTIKTLRQKEHIRVVVTSAFDDPANRVVGKLQDVDDYLNKPFEFAKLRRVVERLLDM